MNDQARVRRIFAFRDEVARLADEGVVTPADATLAAIGRHHETILAELAGRDDIDLSRDEARLSAGMRIATVLGAMALSIAWAMFVSTVWQDLGHSGKLLLVWLPPIALLPAIGLAVRRDPSRYLANIVGVVASIALAIAGPATLSVYQLPDARWPWLLVGVFALATAYRWRLLLPLVIGIGGLGGWLWSLEGLLRGVPVSQAFDKGEPVVLVGVLAIAVSFAPWAGSQGFRQAWRLLGLAAMSLALLLLGVEQSLSMLGLGQASEGFFQVVGLIVFVAITWQGIRRDDLILARGGATALVLYLVFRMADWFWRAIPDWLFFFLMGALAFGVLLVMRTIRLRGRRGVEGRQ